LKLHHNPCKYLPITCYWTWDLTSLSRCYVIFSIKIHAQNMNGTKISSKWCFMCITSSSNSILQVVRNNIMAISSQSSQHVEIINYKASPRNQCPQLWFNTQPNQIGDNTFTTISQMAQVHKESTQCNNLLKIT
jgi:hypothetical protein